MSDQSQGPGWWQATDGRWYPPEQQPGVPPPPPAPMVAPQTNGLAIASLVLGIVWMGGVGAILALVFGYISKNQIDASQGRQGGRGMAVAGIVLGWIGTVGLFLLIALITLLGNNASSKFSTIANSISN